jgi:hypothetical protein
VKGLKPELRRVLAPFPPSTYSSTIDVATRMENEDKIRFASEVVHLVKQFPAKRPSEQWWNKQQWDNKGKRDRIDSSEHTLNEIICHGCKKNDTWRKIVCIRIITGDATIVEIPLI